MDPYLALLLVVDFACIGLLPRVFFRRGRFNARWCLTASPYAVSCTGVLLAVSDVLTPWSTGRQGFDDAMGAIGLVAAIASIALIWLTVGTHRIPLALWHQDDDAPVELVTWGPYARIRHPFYTSFLLALVAGATAAPSPITAATLVAGAVGMELTARREERRLLGSSVGDGYQVYMAGTGRFVPALRRLP